MPIPLRSISAIIVGLVAFSMGLYGFVAGIPASQRTGMLYARFGDQGVAGGTLGIGLVLLAFGGYGVWRFYSRVD